MVVNPIHEMSELIGKISEDLIMYDDVISNPGSGKNKSVAPKDYRTGERSQFTVWLDEGVQEATRNFVKETKGKIRGELGRMIEEAVVKHIKETRRIRRESRTELQEEIQNLQKRIEKLEEKLEDNSEEENNSIGRTRPQRIDSGARHIAGSPEIRPQHIEKAIESVGIGGDPRTIQKYTKDIANQLIDNYNYTVVGKISRDQLSKLDSKEPRILAHKDKLQQVKKNLKKKAKKQ